MIGEVIPEAWGRMAEGPVAHGAQVGVRGEKKVGVWRAEGSGGRFWCNKFFEVWGGISVKTLVCEEGDLEFSPVSNGEPV